ncbi:MAG: sensor histidine kinase [Nocardioides sp.]
MDPLDTLPDGVVIADGEGRVQVANLMARRMLAITDDPVGAPLADVLALSDQRGCGWVETNDPYGGLSSRTGVPEQSWLLPDGTEVLVTARITRDKHLGIAIRSGRGRARLDRERSDLVATVAHELRSPLTGVKGFVQALLNRWDKLNDEQKKLMLTTVHADSDRLSRLIAELLDVARIDTGRLQLYPRPSDPATLVRRVVDSVSAATSRAIELTVTTDEGAEIFVDPDKFTQVVTNLVENGVRHGDGVVRVRLEPGDPGLLRLIVDDEGTGIAPELRKRVFTKFWKNGARGGSGLGLYLVGGLTKAHGGTVTIADAPGGGARIITEWPTEDRRSA